MKAVVIGAGYVGSVSAAALASVGHETTIIDVDRRKVDCINAGLSPIYEPGLESVIRRTVGNHLQASLSYHEVNEADVVFICVGTPSLKDGTVDLSYVKDVARAIGSHMNPDQFTVIVNKSTVPVGTTDLVASILHETSGLIPEEQFAVISNPEFLREGYAVYDIFYSDRIVIGTRSMKARSIMKDLYRPFIERQYNFDIPIHKKVDSQKTVYFETDEKSAELIKYASNAFLAVKISYINEIARLSEAIGASVTEVGKGMGLDSRIGKQFLEVSSGWSGSCFPKDSQELLMTSVNYGEKLHILDAAIQSNQKMLDYCLQKIKRKLKTLNGKRIGILGLTFKPDTDDVRQTQALPLIRKMLQIGARVSVHDPKGMDMFRNLHPDLPIEYVANAEETAMNADAIVLLTHWKEYQMIDWNKMYDFIQKPYILDTRNFLRGSKLRAIGFEYEGIGVNEDCNYVDGL